jgi:regulator of sigma E protease
MGLAILNFLPIPMVDGGRLAFIFVEFLRRGKRIAPEREALVHLVGFALMIMLFFVITYYDVARLVKGDSLLQ